MPIFGWVKLNIEIHRNIEIQVKN